MPMELVRQLPYDHPYRWDGSTFGGPKLWRPNQLALSLWLDAEDSASITLNGSTVSQWSDKSGNGRHATQGTAASQPTYATRQNLLQYSEALDNAFWTKRGTCAITANDTTAPDGTLTADKITGLNTLTNDLFNSNYLSFIMGSGGASYTPSFYIKRISTTGTFTIGNSVNDNTLGRWLIDLSQLPDAWVRITATTPGVTVQVPFVFDASGYGGVLFRGVTGGALSMHVWGVQINTGTVIGDYQKTEGVAVSVIGGKPSINWSGANNIFLDTSNWSLAPDRKYSSFAVASSPTWGGGNRFGRIWVSRSGYQQGYLGQGDPAGSALAIGGSMATTCVVTGVSGANVLSTSFGTAGLSANVIDIAVNAGTPTTLAGNTGALGTLGVRIGADLTVNNGGNPWDGQIGEVIIISGDLTSADRQRMEGYLAWKWALESKLPSGHPYKSLPPTA
jgi:hypothetical protein